MEIKEIKVSIRELTEGYSDNNEGGVFAYGGKLNVRPPYQREFIYKEKERNAVIDTVFLGYPLSIMYWSENEDGTYEVIDGQQRTVSICQYFNGEFAFDFFYYHNLPQDKKDAFLDYRLSICLCKGTESEKLQWFERINIAGKELTRQELRNAVYHGPWVTDAKRYFSKTGCPAYKIGSSYMSGAAIRQDYLEKAIEWKSGGNIETHMAKHQHDATAIDLWSYFQSVMTWVAAMFTNKREIMKGVEWGYLYDKYHGNAYNPAKLEKEITRLLLDDDVTAKKGAYTYVFSGDERCLNIRKFSESEKIEAYERQKGICPVCGKHYELAEMDGDHIKPWSKGGKTDAANCQMLCRTCNRIKGDR